ncbi:recombinase family protein [Catellicoccus marimammalium]|uniref:Resolvase n=1 Tax=Catellicoccus marimammalium M35/04/3 TaxID=1234409 RepID=K8Z7Y0_9ENTE|nr:recombinase family protein [Catellicoccus marimammalium]EKU27079.1 Resolvase [Catellicoccus marimammalium M35/04/3]
MTKLGYYRAHEEEELNLQAEEALINADCDDIMIEPFGYESGKAQYKVLSETIQNLHAGDVICIYDVVDLQKSVIQLSAFFKEVERNDLQVEILNLGITGISMEKYIELIHNLANMEKNLIRRRTSQGLKKARTEGRVGGRPRVSQETIDRIQFLYDTDKYSLREIAEQCGISLGTAYKYVQLH